LKKYSHKKEDIGHTDHFELKRSYPRKPNKKIAIKRPIPFQILEAVYNLKYISRYESLAF
jgi:hypothetical protein